MPTDTHTFIIANWKMNGSCQQAKTLIKDIVQHATITKNTLTTICPPAIYIDRIIQQLDATEANIAVGGQDCHIEEPGAYTGHISASMLRDIGCAYVIIGHSEKRLYDNETNNIVHQKAASALASDLIPIICVGETLEEHESGNTIAVIKQQITESVPNNPDNAPILIAYEPVWAIGTGHIPTAEHITKVHQTINSMIDAPVIYGGSVSLANAGDILAIPEVNGLLIGSASLKAEQFVGILGVAG